TRLRPAPRLGTVRRAPGQDRGVRHGDRDRLADAERRAPETGGTPAGGAARQESKRPELRCATGFVHAPRRRSDPDPWLRALYHPPARGRVRGRYEQMAERQALHLLAEPGARQPGVGGPPVELEDASIREPRRRPAEDRRRERRADANRAG